MINCVKVAFNAQKGKEKDIMVWQFVLALLGSTAVATLIQFFVNRHDKRLEERLNRLERDGLRTQMLVLIIQRPEEKQEILTIAEHYFKDLKGDWYMTSIFNKWIVDSDIAEPEWFQGGKNE